MTETWTPVTSATPTWTPATDDDLTFTSRGTLSSDAVTVGAETLTEFLDGVALLAEANDFTASQSIGVTVPVTPFADIGTTKPTVLLHLHGGGGAIVNHYALTIDAGGAIGKSSGVLAAVTDTDGLPTDEWLILTTAPGIGVLSVTSTDPGELPWISDILAAVPAVVTVGAPTDDAHAATKAYVDAHGGGGVALGETSTTAYRGDRGKTAYDYSQSHTGATDPHGDRSYAAALVDDLSGVTDASTARTNLGLGSLATASTIASADITDATIVAGDLAVSVSGRIPTTVRVASNVNSNTGTGPPAGTTLVDTTGLSFAVTNGTTYYIDAWLQVAGDSNGDLRLAATCPAGTLALGVAGVGQGASSIGQATVTTDAVITASGTPVTLLGVVTGAVGALWVKGYFTATANGTFQIQHGQRNNNATATTVKAGSYLTYHT